MPTHVRDMTHSNLPPLLDIQKSRGRRNAPVKVVPFAGLHDRDVTSPTSVTSIKRYPVIQPTVEGVESVSHRWKNGYVVAIPTECTYEACLAVRMPIRQNAMHSLAGFLQRWMQQMHQLSNICRDPKSPHPHATVDPYCVVTPGGELKRHAVLREVFTPKLYALRPSDAEKDAVVYRFNETMEVVQRLAGKLWPGPILFKVGLSSSSPWTETPFVVESRPPRMNGENDPDNQASPYRHFITLRCPRHPLAVKARKHVSSDVNSLLVSLPIALSHSQDSSPVPKDDEISKNEEVSSGFCTQARQVASRMAVLDGEDCREVFHVPTCEYGRPCDAIVWIDGRQRMIMVQSESPDICRKSLVEVALRHPVAKASGNKKERMLTQAIIGRWKVTSCRADQE